MLENRFFIGKEFTDSVFQNLKWFEKIEGGKSRKTKS